MFCSKYLPFPLHSTNLPYSFINACSYEFTPQSVKLCVGNILFEIRCIPWRKSFITTQKVEIWNLTMYYTITRTYGSLHMIHNRQLVIFYEITNRCSYMQSILFYCYVHSTCFGCFTHPSSGVQFLTLSTATGTNHSIVSATYCQRGLQATLAVSS